MAQPTYETKMCEYHGMEWDLLVSLGWFTHHVEFLTGGRVAIMWRKK